MEKRSLIVLGTIMLLLVAAFPAQARTYQIAHQLAATHPFTPTLEFFAKEVADKTKGRVKFNVLHSGVVGDEVAMTNQLMSGTLDAGILGLVIFENFDPIGCVEDLPYLYKDKGHVRRAIDGDFGKLVSKELIEPLGLRPLGWVEYGFRHFTNNKRPLNKPEDLAGIKFRSGPNHMRLLMFEAFNAKAVPTAFTELFTALQQGTVDGQENSLPIIESGKFYEVQKYLSLTGHIFGSGVIVINNDVWKSFSPEDQKIISEVGHQASALQRELTDKLEESVLETLKKAGMEINEVDKKIFAEACVKPVWEGYFLKQFGARGQAFIDAVAKYAEK